MMNLMENARQQAAAIVRAAYDKAVAAGELPQAEFPAVTVETPKDAANGDWASTVAMQCAKPMRMAPRKIAEALVGNMELAGTCFDKVEIAGGLYELHLRRRVVSGCGAHCGARRRGLRQNTGQKPEKIMVEFVSANPTACTWATRAAAYWATALPRCFPGQATT